MHRCVFSTRWLTDVDPICRPLLRMSRASGVCVITFFVLGERAVSLPSAGHLFFFGPPHAGGRKIIFAAAAVRPHAAQWDWTRAPICALQPKKQGRSAGCMCSEPSA